MSFNLFQLNKNQTLLLKMVAIILIVIHNYTKYCLPNNYVVGQNEFEFDYSALINSINCIQKYPYYIFEYLFSFLGHFGVQLFIFISGYGLCKAFSAKKNNYFSYLLKNYIKLYFLMIFGLCIVIPITYIFDIYGSRLILVENILSFVNKFTLQYHYGIFVYHVGSWWYFALVFQLYTIFPLLYIIINKYTFKGFFIIIAIYLVIAYLYLYNVINFGCNIQESILGHLPEVSLGILLAKKNFNIPIWTVIVAAIVFILSNFFEVLFPVSFLAILITSLYLLNGFISSVKNQNNRLFLHIGKISMILFISNSSLRFFFYKYIPEIPILSATFYFIFLLIICSIAYRIYNQTFMRVEKFIFKIISNQKLD